jgi:hypothetical protein
VAKRRIGQLSRNARPDEEITMQMLLAHDPAVPHRDRLLDAGAMRLHLQRHVNTRDDAEIDPMRIKYRPSESLRVVYRIGGGRPGIVTARTLPPASANGSRPVGGADFTVPELGAAFWAFPNDRRLRDIDRLLNPDSELRACIPGWATSELVSYAPEKCAVFACLDAAHRAIAFGKVFSEQASVARMCKRHEEIASRVGADDDVTIPRILVGVSAPPAVFLAPAAGDRIADLPADLLPGALHRLGRALARIHQCPIPGDLPPWDRSAYAVLRDAALLVGRVRPSLKHAALLVASDLVATRQDGEDAVLLHGDLHLKNAFLSEARRVSLIDFDQAASGPAAADIGSLLAALRIRGGTLDQDFLDGYASVRPLPSEASLAWYTAAALLAERAVRAITRVRVQTLIDLQQVIDDARTLAVAARSRR